MDYNKEYESFLKLLKELYHLRSLEFLLSWDLETKMPVNGIFNRAEQMELLSEIKHSKISSNKYTVKILPWLFSSGIKMRLEKTK